MSVIANRASATDSAAFRTAFGRFATGVAVATCAPEEGGPIGVTINSLASVSLDPPLALFCLETRAVSLSSFLGAGRFALNILADDQAALSNRFAQHHEITPEDAVEHWETGAPILRHALAAVDCSLQDTFGGGDHVILLGRVLEIGWREGAGPLLYYRGGYGNYSPPGS